MESNPVPVVILCGGRGVRMHPADAAAVAGDDSLPPKPLILLGDKPILWHVMRAFSHHGFNRFILCLGYKGEMIERYFSEHDEPGWAIECVDTGIDTNTGGRIFKVRELLDDANRFFVTYADGLSDIDLGKLLRHHQSLGKIGTMTGVYTRSPFGIIERDGWRVTGFKEKPRLDILVNGGYFLFESDFLDYLDEDDTLEGEPLQRLIDGNELGLFIHEGFWMTMNTLKDFVMLDEMWRSGKRPWQSWKRG